ncbi:MAG TPA: hypothetical protein VD995_00640 [Azospirillum sp.]|nr:hypothetical protein [Azospirillum sp.]
MHHALKLIATALLLLAALTAMAAMIIAARRRRRTGVPGWTMPRAEAAERDNIVVPRA